MPRIIGKVKLALTSDFLSVDDIRTLLQAIRNWEQKRQVDIFVGVDAPELTNDEMKYILDNIKPPFIKQIFIPFEK